jgi:hypothetical protein
VIYLESFLIIFQNTTPNICRENYKNLQIEYGFVSLDLWSFNFPAIVHLKKGLGDAESKRHTALTDTKIKIRLLIYKIRKFENLKPKIDKSVFSYDQSSKNPHLHVHH